MTSGAATRSDHSKPPRYSLVVPVYNEGENIASFCRVLAQLPPGLEVLICHDFEGDDTIAALDRIPREDKPPGLRFVLNTLGPGVRYAIEAGMREAAAPVVVVTMADISDDYSRVESMVAGVEGGADVVCASRYMPGGRQIGGPWIKSTLSRMAGLTLHGLSGLPTRDPTNSFKAYSREFLRRTPIESPAGFALAMELPATWSGRTKGASRFRLLSWLPLYLRWYFWAIRQRWSRSGQERRSSQDRSGNR
jgi:glycosyltransferase involved in cell wall biosynthesis